MDITTFINDFEPGNLFYTLKQKLFKNNILEQNKNIEKLNTKILEFICEEKFENEINSPFLFNNKDHNLTTSNNSR